MAAYLTLLAPDDPRIATFNVEELQDKQMTWVKRGSFWEVVQKNVDNFGGQKVAKNIQVNSRKYAEGKVQKEEKYFHDDCD